MESWLLLGFFAALMWGSYVVVSKVVTSEHYFGVPASTATLLMLVGIAVVFIGFVAWNNDWALPRDPVILGAGVLVGILWALGMVAAMLAVRNGADVSKLNPIYNTNTLVTLMLGVLLLKELPEQSQLIKVAAGAVLIVIGAILVGG